MYNAGCFICKRMEKYGCASCSNICECNAVMHQLTDSLLSLTRRYFVRHKGVQCFPLRSKWIQGSMLCMQAHSRPLGQTLPLRGRWVPCSFCALAGESPNHRDTAFYLGEQGSIPALVDLQLSNTYFSGSLPADWGSLGGFQGLHTLQITKCNITSEFLVCTVALLFSKPLVAIEVWPLMCMLRLCLR